MPANAKEVHAEKLFELLRSISKYIEKEIKMYALGGTALTILGIKPSTLDIDINVNSSEDYSYLIKIFEQIGFKKISTLRWYTQEGLVFDLFRGFNFLGTQLRPDCIIKSKYIISFGYIKLYTLALEDIIISKLARGDERDFLDIKAILEKNKIDLITLAKRYKETIEVSAVSWYQQKFLDLIEIKFGQWGWSLNQKLIDEVKKMERILEQKLADAGYHLLGNEKIEELILSILETKNIRYLKAIPFLIYKYSPKIEWIEQKTKEKNLLGQIVTFTTKIFQENGIKMNLPHLNGQAKLNYIEFKEEFELQKKNQEAPTLLIEKQKITAERDLQMWLSLLFTKKEKQIIQNIITNKLVSKTDYEYFSRKTKKKLNAILNLQDLARTIYHQSPKYDLDLFLLKKKMEEWLEEKKKKEKIKLLKFMLNENKIYLTYQAKTEITNLTADLKSFKEKSILLLLKKYESYDFS